MGTASTQPHPWLAAGSWAAQRPLHQGTARRAGPTSCQVANSSLSLRFSHPDTLSGTCAKCECLPLMSKGDKQMTHSYAHYSQSAQPRFEPYGRPKMEEERRGRCGARQVAHPAWQPQPPASSRLPGPDLPDLGRP